MPWYTTKAAGDRVISTDWNNMVQDTGRSLPSSYTVWKSGTTYYYRNNMTGAVSSGTNAATIIQAALDAIDSAGGGKLILRKATYSIATFLTVGAYTEIQGEGWGTLLQVTGDLGSALDKAVISTKGAYGAVIRGIVIRDLAINCASLTHACLNLKGGHSDPIVGAYAADSLVEGCYLYGFVHIGVIITYGILMGIGATAAADDYNIFARGNKIVGSDETVENEYGILFDGRKTRSGGISDNLINDCRYGISLDDGICGIEVRNNKILDGEVGIRGANLGAAGAYYYDCEIVDNKVSGLSATGIGIHFRYFRRSKCAHNSIADCPTTGILVEQNVGGHVIDNWIEDCGYGIDVTGSNKGIISLNHIFESLYDGISLGSNCHDFEITNNESIDNSVNASGVSDGIVVNNCTGLIIQGNRCFDTRTPKLQRYGINEKGTSDYNVIKGNNCILGNLTAPYSVLGVHSVLDGRARTAIAVDLSGSAATLVALHAEQALHLAWLTLLYTEASSADAGITIEVGKESDRDYYYTGATETNKALWYTKNLALLKSDVAAGDTVTFYSPGAKVGTGEVILVLDYLEGA